MKISYLIDSDWAISHLNGVQRIRAKLKQLQPQGLGISIISLAELYEGVIYSQNPQESKYRLERFLSSVKTIDVTDEICRLFGFQRGILRKQGLLIGDFDLMIAATCLHHNLKLLTNNHKHFHRIQDLQIISEDEIE